MKKMTMGRKNIKRINDIGISEYEFNYEQEKDIYCNLCFKKLKKKHMLKNEGGSSNGRKSYNG